MNNDSPFFDKSTKETAPNPKKKSNFLIDDLSESDATENIESSAFSQKLIPKSIAPFIMATAMIVTSEIGDKTFLVAALMAMRHPRSTVFGGAIAALIFMTVLSAVVGRTVPTLLSRKYTMLAAGILFVVFGVKMVREGLEMSPEEGIDEELHEVESELENLEIENDQLAAEEGRVDHDKPELTSNSATPEPASNAYRPRRSSITNFHNSTVQRAFEGFTNLAYLVFSAAWVQTFVMTFLAEWGDRSQIATIAMAAGRDFHQVVYGGIVGHAFCTGLAVIGGKLLATKISLRTVTLGGGFTFLVFAVIYFKDCFYFNESSS
ncbi:hypothetical protein CANCADRAFT_21075 [Tortispora caseinolytica NRRL Y-17796]|uniref:GDT1 family protein n=1 Tax=Tortispora caseinolytica NRRL Y-17796 TaxID=767744 RepID=A0A1E4TKP1_9ASCO|nr:hypothetical protein CANCADRAFT_21075 [Tortispora caseinolytica NRRL Y-17796]